MGVGQQQQQPAFGGLPGFTGVATSTPAVPPNLAAILPPHLQALMAGGLGQLPVSVPGAIGSQPAVNTSNLPGTRQARRLYFGNLPMPISEAELKSFVDDAMKKTFTDLPPGESVVSVYLNMDKKFGFVEFRNPEEATTGLGLDGIVLRGLALRVKRPSDYNPAQHGMAPGASKIPPPQFAQQSGGGQQGVSNQVPDGPNKVFIGGIPYSLTENEVMELLSSFGQLKAFHLVKDRESQTSKGYAFCEWLDPNVTDTAVMGLNNLKIGEKTLTVRRAMPKVDATLAGPSGLQFVGTYQQGGGPIAPQFQQGMNPALAALAIQQQQRPMQPGAAPTMPAAPSHPPTRILVLLQMVSPDILCDDAEYREIYEDIESECRNFGEVRSLVIPRPSSHPVSGLGKVFVEFAAVDQAIKARSEVEGRQFDGRTVAADYWDEGKFARGELD